MCSFVGPARARAIAAAPPPPPPAARPAMCAIVEFRAEKTGSPKIDPRLSAFATEMKQDPLSVFDTFTALADVATLTLLPGRSGSIKNVGQLALLFKGASQQQGKDRLQFEATIDDAKGKRKAQNTYSQASGATRIWVVAKQADGTYFFAATCTY
jgi:hypothetical protein